MEIFSYPYMVKALIVGCIISLIIPLMGVVVVNKKMSIIGDAMSHVALAGVMLGSVMSFQPLLMSIVLCVFSAIFIEIIRKKLPGYADLSTSITMSTGIGLAALLTGFVKTRTNFESFLFGSIVAITDEEMWIVIFVSAVVLLLFVYFYRDLLYISFDENSAKISGVPVDRINLIFMILVALTVSLSARTVGILIISSLMILPVACAMQFGKSYFKTTVMSSVFGIFFTITGLFLSFYLGLKPGGTIVLLGVITLVVVILLNNKKWGK